MVEIIKAGSNFIHPIFMWGLFGITLYALYLGFQSRRTRTATKDDRKELIKGKFSSRHHQMGSILLALMVLGNMVGMGVTYINNGKLFVGPHLLVGLGMTALIATAAALVPYMQQGSELARNAHIGLAITIVGLFGWEAVTGMQILQRIIDNF
ncbi:MAG: DUF4079 domain-containing protein [Cyanothece sp. SIO1E1]|nr:DUF4079 domain-containing protein [Cyanothece sp. SIO1E1]